MSKLFRIPKYVYIFCRLFLLLGSCRSRLGRSLDGADGQSLAEEGVARVDGVQNACQEGAEAGTDPVDDVVRCLGGKDLTHECDEGMTLSQTAECG